jgi:hypothetical protein
MKVPAPSGPPPWHLCCLGRAYTHHATHIHTTQQITRVYTPRNKQRNTPQHTRHTRIYTHGYDREKDDGSAGEQRERATQQRHGSEKVRARESARVCERASKREREQERKRARARERERERERARARVREGARLDLLSVPLLILLEFGLELRPNSFPSLATQERDPSVSLRARTCLSACVYQ